MVINENILLENKTIKENKWNHKWFQFNSIIKIYFLILYI